MAMSTVATVVVIAVVLCCCPWLAHASSDSGLTCEHISMVVADPLHVDCNGGCPGHPLTCCPRLGMDLVHLYSYTYTPEWSIPENAPAVEKCWDAIGRIAGCTLCEPQPIESLYNGAANLIVSLPQCYKLYDACAAMPRPRDHMFGPPESAMGGTGQADATAAAAPPFCDNLLEGLRAGVLRSSLRVWRDGDPAPITDFGDPEVSPTLCPDSKTPAVVMMEEWAARNSSGNYKPKKKKPTTAKPPITDPSVFIPAEDPLHECPDCYMAALVDDKDRYFVDMCDVLIEDLHYSVQNRGVFTYQTRLFRGHDAYHNEECDKDPDVAMCYCTPEFTPHCAPIAMRSTMRMHVLPAEEKTHYALEWTAPQCLDDPSRPWHTVLNIKCSSIVKGNTTVVTMTEIGSHTSPDHILCGDTTNDFCERCLEITVAETHCKGMPMEMANGQALLNQVDNALGAAPIKLLASYPHLHPAPLPVPVGRNSHDGRGTPDVPLQLDRRSQEVVLTARADTCSVDLEAVHVALVSSSVVASPGGTEFGVTVFGKPDVPVEAVAKEADVSLFNAPLEEDATVPLANPGWDAAPARWGVDGARQFVLQLRCLDFGDVTVDAEVRVGDFVLERLVLLASCQSADYMVVPRGSIQGKTGANPLGFQAGLVAAGALFAVAALVVYDRQCRRHSRRPAEDVTPPAAARAEEEPQEEPEAAAGRLSTIRQRRDV